MPSPFQTIIYPLLSHLERSHNASNTDPETRLLGPSLLLPTANPAPNATGGFSTLIVPYTPGVSARSITPRAFATFTRSCFNVSRSRTVTVSSTAVWPSMVMQNGVPASSWRR